MSVILDWRANDEFAFRYRVEDADTGADLTDLGIVYADDEAGIIVTLDRDGQGRSFVRPGTCDASTTEHRRRIRIVPRDPSRARTWRDREQLFW